MRRVLIGIGLSWQLVVGVSTAHAQRSPPLDTSTFGNSATELLVRRAQRRHLQHDSALHDYTAKVRTRVEGRIGWGRFDDGLRLIDYETIADVRWRRPNDLQVAVRGARVRGPRIPGIRGSKQAAGFWTEVFTSEPWFAPQALRDEIRVIGIPDEPAIHPLSPEADRFYRYRGRDSVTLRLPGRVVRAVAVRIEPKLYGPMLIFGDIWLDADSLDVVRLIGTFTGANLWDADPDVPELVTVEVDLEYALHHGRFWLPRRQLVAATFRYQKLGGAVMPATAVTTFADYEVNVATPLVLETTDYSLARSGAGWNCEPFSHEWDDHTGEQCGARGYTKSEEQSGGRWELVVPPVDSLLAFDFGATDRPVPEDPREFLNERLGVLAALSEGLPQRSWHRPPPLMDLYRATKVFRFNRVQGPSLGYEYGLHAWRFTTVNIAGRFGFGDERPTGRIRLERNAPAARWSLSGYRDVMDTDPWTSGTTFGNTLRGLLLGHDDADYYLGLGARVAGLARAGAFEDVYIQIGFERQRSMGVVSGSAINDLLLGSGSFQSNPEIAEGDYVVAHASHVVEVGRSALQVGADGLLGTDAGGRVWLAATLPFTVAGREGLLGLRGGAVVGESLPQLQFRAGGPATVRGHAYGVRRGRVLWAIQTEIELTRGEWVVPVLFADVADTHHGTGLTASPTGPLAGMGLGASALNGWVRFDLSFGVRPTTRPRFDIFVRVPR